MSSPVQKAASPPQVLVVDDDPVSLLVAQRLMESLGCGVHVARDGFSAVRQAGEREYDLILMDCNMPGMDGLEATRSIRSSANGSSKTPIVAVTAGMNRERCLDAGMTDYIEKPIRLEDFSRLYIQHLA